MAWWKGDDRSHSNSKLLAAGLEASGLYWRLVSWSAANESDGRVPGHVIPTLAPGVTPARVEKLLKVLCSTSCGADEPLVHRTFDDGYSVHDYLDYNPSREQCERKRAAERARLAGKRKANVSGVDANTDAGTEQVDQVLNHPGPARPLETPLPPPSGGADASQTPRPGLRGSGTSPRELQAAVDYQRQRAHAVTMARQFGALRRQAWSVEEDAVDEFGSTYSHDEELQRAALEGWRGAAPVGATA